MALSTEKKVGIFFLLTLVALGGLIELVEDWRPFEVQHEYRTYFTSAVGIKIGDPVRMAGVEVGKVNRISIEDSKVRIDFYVIDGTTIKSDSLAQIRQTNLLGGQFLGLDFGSAQGEALPPDSVVPSLQGANIDELISNLDENQERVLGELGELIEQSRDPLHQAILQLESVVRKIDQGQGTLGRIVNDPSLYEEVEGAASDLRRVLAKIESGEGTFGRLVSDDTLYIETTATMTNLREITDGVRNGQGTLGRLFVDDELYASASGAFENFRLITQKANNGEGTLGRLLNDDTLYKDTQATMANLSSITRKIDDGTGTIGRLVNEDSLYRDAKTTLHKVDKTVDGMSDSGPLSALGVVLGTLF